MVFKSLDKQSTNQSLTLKSVAETIALGETLIQEKPHIRLLLIEGPLGAGKTTLVKGIGKSLGIREPITSPTFPLAQHYKEGSPPLIHIDLYRLENKLDANELFFQEEEEAKSMGALMIVEWPERLDISLEEAWKIKLKVNKKGVRLAQVIEPKEAKS